MNNQTSWTGEHNYNWLEERNWTNGVPHKATHAFVPTLAKEAYHPRLTGDVTIDFTLKIEGKIENEGCLLIQAGGLIQNEGELVNQDVGQIRNLGNITSSGRIINQGTFDNERVLSISGVFHNDGVLDNENMLIIMGRVINVGVIDNHSIISNIGELENFNNIQHFGDGRIENKEPFPEEVLQDFYRPEMLRESVPASLNS